MYLAYFDLSRKLSEYKKNSAPIMGGGVGWGGRGGGGGGAIQYI